MGSQIHTCHCSGKAALTAGATGGCGCSCFNDESFISWPAMLSYVSMWQLATAADDSERMSKVLQNKAEDDEKRMESLEEDLKKARTKAEDADTKYEEVAKRLAQCDTDLERAEERADTGETKIQELEEELSLC